MEVTPRVLRNRQAATYVGLRPATLEKMRVIGYGPRFVRLGRAIGYRIDDLDEWLASRRFRSTTEADAAKTQLVRSTNSLTGD
jgi:predicted DNA-binding transcriptional regulator AlpA